MARGMLHYDCRSRSCHAAAEDDFRYFGESRMVVGGVCEHYVETLAAACREPERVSSHYLEVVVSEFFLYGTYEADLGLSRIDRNHRLASAR